MSETARYLHDCAQCNYIGQIGRADVYWCPQALLRLPTMVLRYSEYPSDYRSLPISHIISEPLPPFIEAMHMLEASPDYARAMAMVRAGNRLT